MKSKALDEMDMDEVVRRIRIAGEREYWLRVASTKLSEYRAAMPRLDRFLDAADRGKWQSRAAAWQAEIDRAARR